MEYWNKYMVLFCLLMEVLYLFGYQGNGKWIDESDGLCIYMESSEFGYYLFYIRRRKSGLKNDGSEHAIPREGNIRKSDVDKAEGESCAFLEAKMRRNISPVSTSPASFFCSVTWLCSAGSCQPPTG